MWGKENIYKAREEREPKEFDVKNKDLLREKRYNKQGKCFLSKFSRKDHTNKSNDQHYFASVLKQELYAQDNYMDINCR